MGTRLRFWPCAASLVWLCYILFWFSLPLLPFQDLPNHFTRASVIQELLSDPQSELHQAFSFRLEFVPYVLGDLLLVGLLSIFPAAFTGCLWVLLAFATPVLAYWYFQHEVSANLERRVVVKDMFWPMFLSMYLSTSWFFLSGFFSFQFGIALAFLTLGIWSNIYPAEAALPKRQNTLARYALFCLLVILTYLMHLASFLFLAIAVTVSSLVRVVQKRSEMRPFIASSAPFAALFFFHTLDRVGTPSTAHEIIFRSISNKLESIGTMFYRFDANIDALFFFTFIILLGVILWKQRTRIQNDFDFREQVTVFVAFALAFLVLPVAADRVYDVDNRALPFLFIWLLHITQGVSTSKDPPTSTLFQNSLNVASFILVVLNLLYLHHYLSPAEKHMERYLSALEHVPADSVVLPVSTEPDTGRLQPYLHAGAYLVTRRKAITPYLFSGSWDDAMKHFQYRRIVYVPDVFWYIRNRLNVYWDIVRKDYDYLVVTKPFDESRLPRGMLEEQFSNDAATIYKVLKSR